MKLITVLFLVALFSNLALSQTIQPYKVYSAKGKSVSEKKFLKSMNAADLVFFGEEHDNLIAHFLSLKLFVNFAVENKFVTLGLEMFESDQQMSIDSLQNDQYDFSQFTEATSIWSNFESDYWPMMDTATALGAEVLATNIPRPWASALYHGGRDSLKQVLEGKEQFACSADFPLDVSLSQYAKLKEMAVHMGDKNFVEAQAVKDATMAKFILESLRNGHKVFHLNGCYHSDFQQGILWYVQQGMKEVKSITFSVVTAESIDWSADYEGKADFIFVIDQNFPRSY
jgi:uncharacterized iron-regulated protein